MFKKYLKVYKIFFNNALSYEAQYRSDTWLRLLFNFIWIATLFLTVEVIFTNTTTIAGWSKADAYLLLMFWMIVGEITVTLFGGNLPLLPDLITDGKLDLFLTKPINTLFSVSTKLVLIRGAYRLLMELVLLIWVIWRFAIVIQWPLLALFIPLLITAVIVHYSMLLILNTLGFWFFRIDNINDLLGQLIFIGRFPLDILPRALRIITLTIIPIAFNAYLPMAVITKHYPWYLALYALIFSVFLLYLAVKFWNFALKRYSSASS